MSKKPLTYADAGVNLETWADAKTRIGKLVQSTYTKNVVGKFGQFGGMFDVSFFKTMEKPILVTSVDGVGTKLKIAVEMGIHTTVGKDIVNHCIDDILVMGAKPLVFLDYIATGKLETDVAVGILEGLAEACRESGIALIGGETAEMPGIYSGGDYDIAGTIVGVVDEAKVIDGSRITPGDVIVGLRSNGLHTNGYSLARKIVTEVAGKSYHDIFEPTGRSFGEELLRPHIAYSPIFGAIDAGIVKGIAHLTGGGFQENIDRVLPPNCNARIEAKLWEPDAIFSFLVAEGAMDLWEAYRTFNMGIGLAVTVGASDVDALLKDPSLAQFSPVVIGSITEGSGIVDMVF